jgi:hypothetical protein
MSSPNGAQKITLVRGLWQLSLERADELRVENSCIPNFDKFALG